MGRSRGYSPPVRRERSRSPASLRGRRMDDEEGMRGDGSRSSRKHGRDRDSGRRGSSPPTSLLVRNISRASRPDDLRIPFERYGPVKDVYLPKDYYSGCGVARILSLIFAKLIFHCKNVRSVGMY